MRNLVIQNLKEKDYKVTSKLIASDAILQKELGFDEKSSPSAFKVKIDYKEWNKSHSAEMFCVRLDDKLIGLMTLSRINKEKKSARLGYWIGSQFRGLGYGSEAFTQMLAHISQMGITRIYGSINSTNLSSIHLWEKNGGTVIRTNTSNHEFELKLDC
ncbi:MAG: GNAT family N-acetyltransferase [Candidatus Cloacimonadales bacterium]|nr:GNAT family N-acetyltransferase [Candidatus Cloacimonadales bacterium]